MTATTTTIIIFNFTIQIKFIVFLIVMIFFKTLLIIIKIIISTIPNPSDLGSGNHIRPYYYFFPTVIIFFKKFY